MSRLEIIYDHVRCQFHFLYLWNLVLSPFVLIFDCGGGDESFEHVGEVAGEFVGVVVLI